MTLGRPCDICERRVIRVRERTVSVAGHWAYLCRRQTCMTAAKLQGGREPEFSRMDQLLKDLYAPAIVAQLQQESALLAAFETS